MVTVTSRILSVVMRPVMRWRMAVRVRIPGEELWKQEVTPSKSRGGVTAETDGGVGLVAYVS